MNDPLSIQTNIYKKQIISMTIDAKFENLDDVRGFATKLCTSEELENKKFVYHLQLVINEIFCNIVEHGYVFNSEGLIKIKATREEDGISFDFYDQGISYIPAVVPEPLLTEKADRGFGIFIVKELVDYISYTSKKGDKSWNHLHVFKKFLNRNEGLMQMNHTLANDVLIITPETSNLDAKFAPEFKEKVVQLISENEANHVVLDLNHVQFIDSSGLGSFLSILRLLHTQGGELKLARIHRPIKTMFELVAMNKIFDIHDRTEDAISAFHVE